MTITIEQIKRGDFVRVRQWGGGTLRGCVTEVCEDVKNGRPGIDYAVLDARDNVTDFKWCYIYQIVGHHNSLPARVLADADYRAMTA